MRRTPTMTYNKALQWMPYTAQLLAQCASHIFSRNNLLRSGHH